MAHYKVLTTSLNADSSYSVEVAAYYPVPATNNSVGIAWRAAVVGFVTFRSRRYGGFGTQAQSPVAPAVQSQLDAGELYEDRFSVQVPAGANGAQAQSAIAAAVSAREPIVTAHLGELLRYWGFEGDS